uniref:NADH-ubiquinone oxidoreductase chain 2 n=1 Tax=Lepidocyrtus fimetarius TaxID=2583952 RepID=A0A6G8FF25_9HEXA|nr:NADH dehydrogenase subunit 2 [Lepidocyrtus fimetarius]QIM14965.1 NADH dehydrogenase subunit 2 [Lepidocyrtus fimetarius]
MFLAPSSLLFLMSLLLGSIMAISSNTWFTAWLGLEINLMSMIPLILIKLNQKLTESSIKYFMVQALSSVVMIISVNFNMQTSEMSIMNLPEIMLFLSLLIKSGVPPFHFWFPQMINFMNWTQCFIMFTWQKIAPLILMTYIYSPYLVIAAAASTLTGSLGGLNQKKIKMMMAYSSISHAGWLVISSSMSLSLWLVYFLAYSSITLSVIYPIHLDKIKFINEMKQNPKINNLTTAMNLLSLGGLPPFLGFSMKLSVITSMMNFYLSSLTILFIFPAMISLFYYLRIIYMNLLNKSDLKKIEYTPTKKNFFFPTFSITLNMIMPLFYFLL